MTVDELLENDEEDDYSLSEEEIAEAEAEMEEMKEAANVILSLVATNRLFHEGEITAAEMEKRMDQQIQWAEDNDIELP